MQKQLLSILIGGVFGGLALCVGVSVFFLAGGDTALALPPLPTLIPPMDLNKPRPPATATPLTLTPAPVVTPAPLEVVIPAPCLGPQTLTIALLGIDDRASDYAMASRTDAIILARLDFNAQRVTLLSIPRDLYVPFPNGGYTGIEMGRINTAYLYGEVYGVPGGGPQQFKDTIAYNFGIPVDRFVLVNFEAFVQTVDAVGGVEVEVPAAIYDDQFPDENDSGTMLFALDAGWQHFDGLTALRYARTRHQDDDYHRNQRQQQVLLALRDKMLSPTVIPQLPTVINAMSGSVRTDLAPEEIAALLCASPQIDRAALTPLSIDANMVIPWITPDGGSVSIPDREAIAPVVSQFLLKP
jgi:LCP family protein required for cell wall assembly